MRAGRPAARPAGGTLARDAGGSGWGVALGARDGISAARMIDVIGGVGATKDVEA